MTISRKKKPALMLEMVDRRDLKSLGKSRAGSSPAERTTDMYTFLSKKYKLDRKVVKDMCLFISYSGGMTKKELFKKLETIVNRNSPVA